LAAVSIGLEAGLKLMNRTVMAPVETPYKNFPCMHGICFVHMYI